MGRNRLSSAYSGEMMVWNREGFNFRLLNAMKERTECMSHSKKLISQGHTFRITIGLRALDSFLALTEARKGRRELVVILKNRRIFAKEIAQNLSPFR